MNDNKTVLKGKRILALDYGNARIGVAVCDEMHIVISTRPVIKNDDKVWDNLLARIDSDRIDVILVGVPIKLDGTSSPIIKRIEQFIARLRRKTDKLVIEVDESFSTLKAKELMFASGVSKKRRQQKGTKDTIAAAVILKDVLEEIR